MSGWTMANVCDRAELEFAYYQDKEPASAVRNAMASILSDLGKFDKGRVVLGGLDMRKMFRIMVESDDTALQELIRVVRAIAYQSRFTG